MFQTFFNSPSYPGVKILTSSGNLITLSPNLAYSLTSKGQDLKALANFIDAYVTEGEPPMFWTSVGVYENKGDCLNGVLFLTELFAKYNRLDLFVIFFKDLAIAFVPEASGDAAEFVLSNLAGCRTVDMLYVYKFFPLELMSKALKLDEGKVELGSDNTFVFMGKNLSVEWTFEANKVTLSVKPKYFEGSLNRNETS